MSKSRVKIAAIAGITILLCAFVPSYIHADTPTSTFTVTPTLTAETAESDTATPTISSTGSPAGTFTHTETPNYTITPTATETLNMSATGTAVVTPTFTPSANCCVPVATLTVGLTVVTGLAIDQVNHKYYVSDGSSSGTIRCYDSGGAGCGTFASGLNDPYGLALESGLDYIWVADSANSKLKRFAIGGALPVETLDLLADTGQNFTHDVALDNAGNIYAVVGHDIVKYVTGGAGHVLGLVKSTGTVFNEAIAYFNGRVYVGDASGKLRVYDANTFTELSGSPVLSMPSIYPVSGITEYCGMFFVSFGSSFSTGEYGVYSETGDGVFTPLAWSLQYQCAGIMEPKGIGVAVDAGLLLVTQKFYGNIREYNICVPLCAVTPTITGTLNAAATATFTPTPTFTVSGTTTFTVTGTPTWTYTPTLTATGTLSAGPTGTFTHTHTRTQTVTATMTSTWTWTPTPATGASPADLTIEKSVTGDQPSIGANVTFLISVRNDTSEDVTNLMVWDTLPDQLVYTGYSAAVTPEVSGNYLVFAYPVLPAGGTISIEITARVLSIDEGLPIGNRAWCDYNDDYYTGPGRHPPVCSNTSFYPADKPVIYPNPYNRNTAVNGTLKFENLVAGSSIRIYTLSAETVYTITSSSLIETWQGRNTYGGAVSPGVYYCVIVTPDNHKYVERIFIISR